MNSYTVINNEKQGQFEVSVDNEIAYLTYRFYKKDIAFMHTFVPPKLNGKGIATAIAVAAFAYAKENHLPVMVYCPFIAAFVKKNPAYEQQVDKQYR